MAETPEQWLEKIDWNKPSAARMYDYYLGGKENSQVDREAAEEVLRRCPEIRFAALSNRQFLVRAVRFLADEVGIRQFIDIGTGLPTMENVHEVAGRHGPGSKVVYVDFDPAVLAHARALLATDETTTVLPEDMRNPEALLGHPEIGRLIDLNQPVALLMVAMLHFIRPEENPHELVARYRDALPDGSYMVITHGSGDVEPDAVARACAVYEEMGANAPLVARPIPEIKRFFDGLEPVEPGAVLLPEWRPDERTEYRDQPERTLMVGGVGRVVFA